MGNDNMSSYAPNMRFGTSFLDFKKHKKMKAVNDEVLMDKRTGQLVYKRDTDGKLIYYAQENMHLNNYMRQLKTLMTENRKTYIRPSVTNCEYCDYVYFISYNIEMVDFEFEDASKKAFMLGGKFANNHPEEHSFVQETNGFFVQLNGRPRDRALLSFMTAMYDNYYKNYDGSDPDELAKKEMYNLPNYDTSNAVINYTVSYYDSTGGIVAQDTSDGYVRANEISYIPFVHTGIYNRGSVAYATIRINSVSTPKIADLAHVTRTSGQDKLFGALFDNVEFDFISCNVSIFVCTEDPEFTPPTPDNTVPLLVMSWEEFEEELIRAKTGGGASGIVIDVDEPDPIDWEDITIWAEIIRYIKSDGTEEETDHKTNVDELEHALASIEYHDANFNTDASATEDYFVETGISSTKL